MSFEQSWIQLWQYNLLLLNPQEHVLEAERNNRVIKERVCTCYHCLPYVHVSRTLTKYMVIECTKKPNYFPAQNSVSNITVLEWSCINRTSILTKTVKIFLGSMFKHMTKQLIATLVNLAHWIVSIRGQLQALKVVMSYGTWQETVYLFTAASHQFKLHKMPLIWFIYLQNWIKCLLDWNLHPDTM